MNFEFYFLMCSQRYLYSRYFAICVWLTFLILASSQNFNIVQTLIFKNSQKQSLNKEHNNEPKLNIWCLDIWRLLTGGDEADSYYCFSQLSWHLLDYFASSTFGIFANLDHKMARQMWQTAVNFQPYGIDIYSALYLFNTSLWISYKLHELSKENWLLKSILFCEALNV